MYPWWICEILPAQMATTIKIIGGILLFVIIILSILGYYLTRNDFSNPPEHYVSIGKRAVSYTHLTHDRLMDFLTTREDSATEKGGQPVLKSYYDRQSGIWGLRRGERMTAVSYTHLSLLSPLSLPCESRCCLKSSLRIARPDGTRFPEEMCIRDRYTMSAMPIIFMRSPS